MSESKIEQIPYIAVTITSVEERKKLESIFKSLRTPMFYQFNGSGTAPTEILNILGLGSSERLISIFILPKCAIRDLIELMDKAVRIRKKGHGMIMTVPITGLQKSIHQMLNKQNNDEINRNEMGENGMTDERNGSSYTAILAAVLRGYSNDAVSAAQSAGATGGTIINGRKKCSEEFSRQTQMPGQEEQEIVLIVTRKELKTAVMNAISKECGLGTPAHGTIFSFPVENVTGID